MGSGRLKWCVGVAVAVFASGVAFAEPEPASVALTQDDLPGWTQTLARHTESWLVGNETGAPAAPGDIYRFQADFGRGPLALAAEVGVLRSDLADEHWQNLHHNAMGQTAVQLPRIADEAFGFWENVGDTRRAAAAARRANVIIELRLDGVTATDGIGDSQIGQWLALMAGRASAAHDQTRFDWTQLSNDTLPPIWSLILDQASAGGDWEQESGLDLASTETSGQLQQITASRDFNHVTPLMRTLSSSATVYPSVEEARANGMTAPGKAVPAPALGDESAEDQANATGGGREQPSVTYTVLVRHGTVVIATRETGVVYTLDSSAEVDALAAITDTAAAAPR